MAMERHDRQRQPSLPFSKLSLITISIRISAQRNTHLCGCVSWSFLSSPYSSGSEIQALTMSLQLIDSAYHIEKRGGQYN